MAGSGGATDDSLIEKLASTPYRFSFVQAVRLLQNALQTEGCDALGTDTAPSKEGLRLRGVAAQSFPPNEVAAIEKDPRSDNLVVSVAFMGLYGPTGVLPDHDTQRIIDEKPIKSPVKDRQSSEEQGWRDKFANADDRLYSERDFLDLFNHRLLALFYRAAVKYSVPIGYERSYMHVNETDDRSDVLSRVLYSLVGMGTAGLQQRLAVPDEFLVEFSGLYRNTSKNVVSLEQIVSSYLCLGTKVEQFVGQWLKLSRPNMSIMPSAAMPLGQNCSLGQQFILGDRVWDVAGKFRVRIGPVDYGEFSSLLPGRARLLEIAQLIRQYVGLQYDFEIQLELLAESVPELQLRSDLTPQLGFNTWLFSNQPTANKTDAVFVEPGMPLDSLSA